MSAAGYGYGDVLRRYLMLGDRWMVLRCDKDSVTVLCLATGTTVGWREDSIQSFPNNRSWKRVR